MDEDLRLLKRLVKAQILDRGEAKGAFKAFQKHRRESPTAELAGWLVDRRLLSREQAQSLGLIPTAPPVLHVESRSLEPEMTRRDPSSSGDRLDLAESLRLSPLERRKRMEQVHRMRFGPYKVRREIARGGMGAVYLVHHPTLGGPFALKVLLAKSKANERQKKRFRREIETIRRLDHPGIIKIVDHGELDGIEYLTMEFIDGLALDELFVAREVSIPELLGMIREMALALDHAHSKSVIHRDLKPANVLVRSRDNAAVITDFGLAKDLLDSAVLSRSGTVIGTPRYLSPEQVMAEHDKIGPTTDIYALGVILFEGLTGERPFDAESVEDLYQMIEDEPPPDPRKFKDTVPEPLVDVCLKALAKRQEDRYQTGAELAADLETYLKTGKLKVRMGPARGGLEPRIIAALVVLFIGVAGLTFWIMTRGGDPANQPLELPFDPASSPYSRDGDDGR